MRKQCSSKESAFEVKNYNVDGTVVYATKDIKAYKNEFAKGCYEKVLDNMGYSQHGQCFIKLQV